MYSLKSNVIGAHRPGPHLEEYHVCMIDLFWTLGRQYVIYKKASMAAYNIPQLLRDAEIVSHIRF